MRIVSAKSTNSSPHIKTIEKMCGNRVRFSRISHHVSRVKREIETNQESNLSGGRDG